MSPLELVNLAPLMERTEGRSDLMVAFVDGPVSIDHPDLQGARVYDLKPDPGRSKADALGEASHATFISGQLCASRQSKTPGICPGCTLLHRQIFSSAAQSLPSTNAGELAEAIYDCVRAGARLINLSVGIARSPIHQEYAVVSTLNYAAARGAIVVVAAGNDAAIGSTTITSCQATIPVVACDELGRPTAESNLGASIGLRGLSAPGDRVFGLGPCSGYTYMSGTSVAAPFVTGALALIWSLLPAKKPEDLRLAVTGIGRSRIVPPLLDAWKAYLTLNGRN